MRYVEFKEAMAQPASIFVDLENSEKQTEWFKVWIHRHYNLSDAESEMEFDVNGERMTEMGVGARIQELSSRYEIDTVCMRRK